MIMADAICTHEIFHIHIFILVKHVLQFFVCSVLGDTYSSVYRELRVVLIFLCPSPQIFSNVVMSLLGLDQF